MEDKTWCIEKWQENVMIEESELGNWDKNKRE